MEDLHVVGIPGIGQLIEDHQLHRGAQVVSVSIEQLPGESVAKAAVSLSHSVCESTRRNTSRATRGATHLTHNM